MPRKDSIDTIRKSLDRASQELRILHEISQSISCNLDLDQVLKEIIDLVVDVTRCDSCLALSGGRVRNRISSCGHPRTPIHA